MLARETQFCWSRLAAKRYWWMRAGCHAGRIQNWILAKMWFHPIYGGAASASSMLWRSRMPMRITWAA